MADERTRTYSWEDPASVPRELGGLPGIDVMRMMIAGELPQAAIARTLGFRLVEADDGRAVFECEPAEFHYNPIGIGPRGLAMHAPRLRNGVRSHDDARSRNGLDDARAEGELHEGDDRRDGLVRCTGTVVHPGRTVATTEARIEEADGRLYAHGTSTILVLAALT